MRKVIPLVLFLLQVYFILYAVDSKQVSKEVNPFLLLASCLLLAIYYLVTYTNVQYTHELNTGKNNRSIAVGSLVGGALLAALSGLVTMAFTAFPDPANFSDVVPQVDALYTRFISGKFPYYPLEQYSWHPFPVYMPLHWLPLAITHLLDIDVRWAGMILLICASAIYGIFIVRSSANIFIRLYCITLPSLAFYFFLRWAARDIAVSYELNIAAYYLVLATGLAWRNLPLTVTGIILCLLSRYTMVFWLPLFIILLWFNTPHKSSYKAWGAIVLSITLIYIIPFYLQDPSILKKGVAYHNGCAVAEWIGYGDDHISWSFESGLYFAPYIKQMFSGDMEHRVFICRAIQGSAMLAIMGIGLLLHKRFKHRINFYDLSLVMLFLFLLFFFMLSPLTYKYYFLPFLMVSVTVAAKIILLKRKGSRV